MIRLQKNLRPAEEPLQWNPLLCFGLLLLLTWHLAGCTLPGGNRNIPQVQLTIQNTLPVKRDNVPIVLSLAELQRIAPDFSFDAYLVVSGQPPAEIPSQADDMDYDGQKDELVFLVDLEPQETREVSIRYSPTNQMAVTLGFTKRTRAGIFPELGGFAALESERIAYLLHTNGSIQPYGKKAELLFNVTSGFQSDLDYRDPIPPELRRIFEENGSPLSPNATIDVTKQGSRWRIIDPANRQRYFVSKAGKGIDVYKTTGLLIDRFIHRESTPSGTDIMTPLTSAEGFGCGGFAIWNKTEQKRIAPSEATKDYVRIIADGPVRSVVQRIIPDVMPQSQLQIALTSTVLIYAGHRWGEHRVKVQGLPRPYRIAVGLSNHSAIPTKNEQEGWLWSWDNRSAGSTGLGVIYPVAQFDAFEDGGASDSEAGHAVLITPDEKGEVSYRFFSVWGEGDVDIQTKETFDQYVQVMATEIRTPPVIKFTPQTSDKSAGK